MLHNNSCVPYRSNGTTRAKFKSWRTKSRTL